MTGPVGGSRRGDAVSQLFAACPGPSGLDDEDLILAGDRAEVVSCHVTHGPGFVASAAEPPATDGFSASWLVWMFSDGTGIVLDGPANPRPWPPKIQLPVVLSNRLAKICLWPAERGRVLVPRRPRHRTARSGEVDRRNLAVLRLVEVERPAERGARAGLSADRAAALRRP